MYYIIGISFVLLSSLEGFFKNFGVKNFFFIIVASAFIVMQCFNTWSPDISNYQLHYELINNDYVKATLEPLHIFIIEISHNFDLNFEGFFIVYGLLIMVPFLYFIKKTSPLPVFVLSVFFFIPYFPDITQIRNFLSLSLFFIAIYLLSKNKFLFYLLIILSVLAHYSALILVAFFLVRKLDIIQNYKKSNIIILVGMALLTLVPRQISEPLITAINPKYSTYLEATSTYIGTIALFLPFFLLNNLALYHYKNYYSSVESIISNKYKIHIPIFIQLIQYGNYLILIQYFIRDFSRITMNLSILSYIYLSIILFYGWSHNYTRIKLLFLRYGIYLWVFFTFVIVFLLLNDGEYMKIIEKTFSSNSFYGK